MARYMLHFDGFHSKESLNAWPQGPGGISFPGANPWSDPSFQDAVPNEGRYFGQAWNGSYCGWWGGLAYFSPKDVASFGLKDWWQWGYWMKYNGSTTTFDSLWRPEHEDQALHTYPVQRTYTGGGGIRSDLEFYYRYGSTYPTTYIFSGQYAPYLPNQLGKWFWCEERLYGHLSTGIYEMRINGTQWVRMTDIRTLLYDYGGFNKMYWYMSAGSSNSWDLRWDDVYVMAGDSEGDFEWFGRSVAEPIVPTGDGDSSDGSPSTGTAHYAVVDELPKNDGDYIILTAGNAKKELYTFSDMDTSRTRTIHGVKVVARAKKTNAAVRKLRAICKVGGTVYSGDTYHVSPGWREIQHIWQVNPNTTSAWTAAEVNGAQFGFEQVT